MIKNLDRKTTLRLIELQNSILNHYIPQSYKNSIIIPISKPNSDKTTISSYRPISLNSCLSKLLDKIIAKRLWWFVSNDKLIHNSQTGFKKGKSAIDSLLLIDHLIARSISRRNHTSIISLDFAKAFDRIGLHSILDQLIEWKTGLKLINYVKNFMTNRKITVRINTNLSTFLPLHDGIPQGFPLSVVLFIIAYNQLSVRLIQHPNINLSAYADDFNIILKLKNRKNMNINLDPILNTITNWSDYSGARLSTTKCKHMHICRKLDCNCTLTTGNIQIQNVTSLKILGLHFNNKYRWNTHIEQLTHKLKQLTL